MKKKYINLMIDYVEGRITVEEFFGIYYQNFGLRKYMNKILYKHGYTQGYIEEGKYKSRSSGEKLHEVFNIKDSTHRLLLVKRVALVLRLLKVKFKETNDDSILYEKYAKMQPSRVNLEKEYLDKIKAKFSDFKEEEKIQRVYDYIDSIFIFDSYEPEWIQAPEWPIDEFDTPYVFKNQIPEPGSNDYDSEVVEYYFYHPKSKEKRIVTQRY